MITKIQGEAPFQVLTNNFSISPSQEGYTLQISADGINYSNLFSVGANVTRLVTGVAANSYYRLLGNASEVSINWMKTCVTEGGGGGDMSNYYTKDETHAEISAATSPIQEQLDDVERVTASALTELHNDVLELSGATPDLSAYWTSAQTQDAINEKAAKYFTKEAPIIMLDQDNINAFFGENTIISLLDITNGIYNDNPFDLETSNYGDFTIDAANKLFYIENVPAGFYRIGVNANNVEDPTLTFKVLIDGEEIETNTTDNLPYAVNGYMAILLNNGNTYGISNWTLEADAERITFKYDEENEVFDVEVIYKPTIDEVAADVNEAFSAITETQQVASAGLNSLDDKISILSGNTYTKAEVDAEITGATENMVTTGDIQNFVTSGDVATQISAATSDMKTYVDNKIDGFDTAVTLSRVDVNENLRLEGSTVCTAGDIAWQALGRPMFNTTNIQQYEIGNAPYDPGLGTVNYLKLNYVGETDNMDAFTGVYYALPANGEFVDGVPVQLTRTTSLPSTVYNTPAGAGSGNFIWDNVNLTITWNRQPVIVQHVPGVVKSDGEITKVKKLTQAEYDAIVTPDVSTLYIIVNN